MLNYWLSRHFLCRVWMCRVSRAAKVFRCFTANVHIVGTFTVLPKLFVTSGQEVARVVLCQILIWQEDESLPYSLIIMTPLGPLTQPLICQWLHCSSSDPFTLFNDLEAGRQVVLRQHLTLTCRWSRLSLVVCGCAVSSTQLFLWVN